MPREALWVRTSCLEAPASEPLVYIRPSPSQCYTRRIGPAITCFVKSRRARQERSRCRPDMIPLIFPSTVRARRAPAMGQRPPVTLRSTRFRADHLSIDAPLIDGWRSMKGF